MGEGRNNLFDNICGYIKTIKEVPLDANNETKIVNLFKIHKTVEIREAYLEVSEGQIINMTGIFFDVYDGTVSINLTSAGLANLSGAKVGAFIIKDEDKAEIAQASINDQVRVIESISAKDTYQSFFITQKFNTDTFIRMHYTTTETPMNAKIKMYIRYRKTNGGFIEVVK
jgi:hypothetical protein